MKIPTEFAHEADGEDHENDEEKRDEKKEQKGEEMVPAAQREAGVVRGPESHGSVGPAPKMQCTLRPSMSAPPIPGPAAASSSAAPQAPQLTPPQPAAEPTCRRGWRRVSGCWG